MRYDASEHRRLKDEVLARRIVGMERDPERAQAQGPSRAADQA